MWFGQQLFVVFAGAYCQSNANARTSPARTDCESNANTHTSYAHTNADCEPNADSHTYAREPGSQPPCLRHHGF